MGELKALLCTVEMPHLWENRDSRYKRVCDSYNMGLGRFKEDPRILQNATNYLGEAQFGFQGAFCMLFL